VVPTGALLFRPAVPVQVPPFGVAGCTTLCAWFSSLSFPPSTSAWHAQAPVAYLTRSKPAPYTVLGRRLVVWCVACTCSCLPIVTVCCWIYCLVPLLRVLQESYALEYSRVQ
jgi:hypothetical protein